MTDHRSPATEYVFDRNSKAQMIWAMLKSYMLDECSLECAAVSNADEKNLINLIVNSLPIPDAAATPPHGDWYFGYAEGIRDAKKIAETFDVAQPSIRNDMRALFRNVDDDDWSWLLSHLNDGGRARFWKTVIADVRGALAVSSTEDK